MDNVRGAPLQFVFRIKRLKRMRQELTQVVQQNCLKKGTRGSLRNGAQRVLSHLKYHKNKRGELC